MTDSLALQSYERYFGPANYSVNIGKIHYLFLDNILFDHAPTAGEEYTIGLTDEIHQLTVLVLIYYTTKRIFFASIFREFIPIWQIFKKKKKQRRGSASALFFGDISSSLF